MNGNYFYFPRLFSVFALPKVVNGCDIILGADENCRSEILYYDLQN